VNAATIVALIGVTATIVGSGGTVVWKLATMIAEIRTTVRSELHHNGGESVKDYARQAASDASAARAGVERAHRRIDGLEQQLRGIR
jgi:hypothetical protein